MRAIHLIFAGLNFALYGTISAINKHMLEEPSVICLVLCGIYLFGVFINLYLSFLGEEE